MVRTIIITDEAIEDINADEVEEVRGDPVLRRRVDELLCRDCARRKLLARVLPALSPEARRLLHVEIDSWGGEQALRDAGHQILDRGMTHRLRSAA